MLMSHADAQVLHDLHRTAHAEHACVRHTLLDHVRELALGVVGHDEPERARGPRRVLDRGHLVRCRQHCAFGHVEIRPIEVHANHEAVVQSWAVEGDPRRVRTAPEQLVAHIGHDLTDRTGRASL